VFDRLYVARSQPARRESSSGLGLAIVRELVEAMGGSVVAAPSPSGGARLVVRVPLLLTSQPAPIP
jgi:two-component system, OmpR family, sensor histidine kinase BaeS